MTEPLRFLRVYRENWKLALIDYAALFAIIVIVGTLVTATGNQWLWLVAIVAGAAWPAFTPRWTVDGEPIDMRWSGWVWDRAVARRREG